MKIFKISRIHRIHKYTSNFLRNSKNFCDEISKFKFAQVHGLLKPAIKSTKQSSPKHELFYGIPSTKEIPKTSEDLLKKIEYVNNYEDMVELFENSKKYFSGKEMSFFLERLNMIYYKEIRHSINKSKDQQNIFKDEKNIRGDYEEKLNIFLEELEKFVDEKGFGFQEIVVTYFEVLYRFKKEIPKEFSDLIFEECKNEENFSDGQFRKEDLIKLTFILSRYKLLLNTKSNAEEAFEVVANQLVKIGLSNYTKEELLAIIKNLSYRNVFPDLELFTKLEPHILKYINDYEPISLLNIFCAYLRNYRGSNFIIQTLGFSIASNMRFMNLLDLTQLLEVSNPKYFNRPELSIKFMDIFLNIFTYVSPLINQLRPRDISIIIRAILGTGYNDKKFLHLLSTVYLKYTEKEEFQKLVSMIYYFAVCDLENSIFAKKALENLNLNLICIQNYLDGHENLENLIGLYDRHFIKIMNDNYMKNVETMKDKLKYFERIQSSEEDIFYVFDSCIKMMWSMTYFISKLKDLQPENMKEFINTGIKILNYIISNLNTLSEEDTGVKIKILKSNVDKIFQSYLFLALNGEKFKIKTNINLDFLKLNNIEFIDTTEDVYEYDKFLEFKRRVKNVINNTVEKCEEFIYEKDYTDITDYNVFKYLKADFFRIKEGENLNKFTEIIFINDPYDYFDISMNHSGYNKFRKILCSALNLKFVEIDYPEFLIFYKDIEISEDNFDQLVTDFLNFKLS